MKVCLHDWFATFGRTDTRADSTRRALPTMMRVLKGTLPASKGIEAEQAHAGDAAEPPA